MPMPQTARELFAEVTYHRERERRERAEGIVLRATAYITFPKDEPGDDPLRSVYDLYEASRDIERVLKGMRHSPGGGLSYDALQVEVVDAEYGALRDGDFVPDNERARERNDR